jgi:bifunctional non-homologous end joining protein LigD
MPSKDYAGKRVFEKTPEPPPRVEGDVDPTKAVPGRSFVIHQHYATRLHFDLRLEMMNGDIPVLVSWAVPKNLPMSKAKSNLAVHVEDHPFEYGTFAGSIPKGNYGAGQVRIFDSGTYEMLEQEGGKIKFRLEGRRLKGVYSMIHWKKDGDQRNWLVRLTQDERDEPHPIPDVEPMIAAMRDELPKDGGWIYEPSLEGERAMVLCSESTSVQDGGRDVSAKYPDLLKINERLVAIDAMLDGTIASGGKSSKQPNTFIATDLLYLDGTSLIEEPLLARRKLLDELVVPAPFIQVVPWLADEPEPLIRAAKAKSIESIVAKRAGSSYASSATADDWVVVQL